MNNHLRLTLKLLDLQEDLEETQDIKLKEFFHKVINDLQKTKCDNINCKLDYCLKVNK